MEQKKDKIKMLVYADSVTASTGFGVVMKNILLPLHNTGKYEITMLGINYWGTPHQAPFEIWPVGVESMFSGDKDPYGRLFVQRKIAESEFDILFMLQDSFILEFVKDFLPKLRQKGKKFTSVIYFPIDGIPKKSWIEAMNVADIPVTYTEFAKNECIKIIPSMEKRLRIIPHGANMADFYPLSYRENYEFKKAYYRHLADRFIVLNVNRNQQRKDIFRTMLAFREFHRKYPDTLLNLHLAVKDQGGDILAVADSLGLVPNVDFIFPYNFSPSTGFPVDVLNRIYNSADVVISTSKGEGWGLAQVEAMACKTLVISPNNTACTEIVGEDRGLLVKSGHDIDHLEIMMYDNEVLRPVVNVQDLVDKLELAYNDEVLRMKLAENGYNWVRNTLVWENNIVPLWEVIFEEAMEMKNKGHVVESDGFGEVEEV